MVVTVIIPVLNEEKGLARVLEDLPRAGVREILVATRLIRVLYGFHCTDLGPFRAVRWKSLEDLSMTDETFGWTVEMQIKALRRGLRIVEVPVSYRSRIGSSKISGTLSGSVRA